MVGLKKHRRAWWIMLFGTITNTWKNRGSQLIWLVFFGIHLSDLRFAWHMWLCPWRCCEKIIIAGQPNQRPASTHPSLPELAEFLVVVFRLFPLFSTYSQVKSAFLLACYCWEMSFMLLISMISNTMPFLRVISQDIIGWWIYPQFRRYGFHLGWQAVVVIAAQVSAYRHCYDGLAKAPCLSPVTWIAWIEPGKIELLNNSEYPTTSKYHQVSLTQVDILSKYTYHQVSLVSSLSFR